MNSIRKMVKGFTLIELLIVIAIIGILAVAFLPALTSGPQKARDAARKAGVGDIVTALEAIVVDGGSYLANTTPGTGECLNFTVIPGKTIAQKTKKIPKDYSGSIAAGQICTTPSEYYYKNFRGSSGNYFVAVEVELAASANVDNGITSALVKAAADGNTALGYTDETVGGGDVVGGVSHYYYMQVK